MSDTVTFDNLGLKLSEIIGRSGYLVKEAATETLKEYAGKIRDDIPNTTAFKDGNHRVHLRNSFEVAETMDETGNVSFVVQAGVAGHKYSIVHLVELGHRKVVTKTTKKGTKRKAVLDSTVPPHPFLGPLADAYAPLVHDAVEKAVAEAIDKAASK